MNKYAMTLARQMLSARDVRPVSPDKSDRIRDMISGRTAHMERWLPKQASYEPCPDDRVRTLVYGMVKTADGSWWTNNWHKPVGAVLGSLVLGGLGSLLGGRKGGLAGMLIGGIGGWKGMDWLHQNPVYRKWFDKTITGNPGMATAMRNAGMRSPLEQANARREQQVSDKLMQLKQEKGMEAPKLLPKSTFGFGWVPWSNNKRNERRVNNYHKQMTELKDQANAAVPQVEVAQ